jgi:hypothetical protein
MDFFLQKVGICGIKSQKIRSARNKCPDGIRPTITLSGSLCPDRFYRKNSFGISKTGSPNINLLLSLGLRFWRRDGK